MKANSPLDFLAFCVTFIITTNAQTIGFGCPPQWETYESHCYQFVFYPPRTYTEAAQACWSQGSALVSINDFQEHRFISGYLLRHDSTKTNLWYTSGETITDTVKWNGDGSYLNQTLTQTYWNSLDAHNLRFRHIVYQYDASHNSYGWTKARISSMINYICEIPRSELDRLVQQSRTFEYGEIQTEEASMKIGPRFIVEPINMVVIDAPGSNVIFIECVATGNPQPQYTWYQKNATTNTRKLSSSLDSAYTFTNGRFSVQSPIDKRDAGTYQCQAENRYGSILTAPVTISFGYLNQFSPNKQGFIEAYVYQGTTINCNAPSAKPGLAYQWYKNNAKGFIRPELMTYFFISSNGNLYLSEVQYNDAGEYFCIVTLVPPAGAKLSTDQPPSRTSKGIELRLKISPSTKYGPIIHNDFIAVFPKPPQAGHEVKLECFAYGRSLIYSWTREDGNFPPGTKFTDSNRILTIPNAQLQDQGNYTCNVMTTAYQSADSRSIYLTIEAKPFFTFPLRNMHADEGGELTWRCEAQAIPFPVYSWYKNSQLLTSIPGDLEIRQNVLFIKTLDKKRHSGMYQCAAANTHGTTVSGAQLRVLSFKPNFVKNPMSPTTIGAVGGNVTIPCSPEAAPVPDITWLHNGQQVGGAMDDHYQILIDGTMKITQLTFSDQGTYTCKATNSNGEGSSSTVLSVMAGLAFQFRPTDTYGDVNRTSFLICQATYDHMRYDLVYVWKFNGRVIDPTKSPFYRQGDQKHVYGMYVINAQYYHTGTYDCIAQTVLTSITAAAFLHIQGPPGEPAGAYVEDGSIQGTSVRLMWSWEPRNNHGFPVQYFFIEAKTDYTDWTIVADDVPSPVTQVLGGETKHAFDVTNLLPYNSYSFRVTAKNERGVGTPSRPTADYKIPAAPPSVAPINVGGGMGTVGVLTMTWQPVTRAQEGGPGINYLVHWRLINNTRTSFKTKLVGNVSQYTSTVGLDNYYLQYEVQVQARNVLGGGPMSQIALVYSSEGMPVAVPTNVRGSEINGTAIMISWDPVSNTRAAMKGRILGYEIDYYDAFDPNGQVGSNYMYCDCAQGPIIGLDPNANYWVNVEVFNTAGTGPLSEKYLVGTFEEPPKAYPQYVYIHPHGEHSARIEWRGVNIVLGEAGLSGYKIMYWPITGDIRTANETVVGKVTSAIIYGLQYDTMYKLRVMGINRGGDGKKSPEVYFTFARNGAVNTGNMDPSTSELMLASHVESRHRRSLVTMVICVCLSYLMLYM